MVSFFGDYDTTETVVIPFNTFTSDDPSASATITNLVAGDVEIHKDGGTTQRSSDAGVTVSIDFDTVTGNHIVSIDLSDNTDAGFYAAGSRYQVRIEGTTVDGATINAWIGAFSIGCTLRPTVDGRTLDVTATGAAGIDWANVENQSTAVDLSGTDIQLVDTCTTNTDMRGTDSAALASVCTEGRLAELDAGNLPTDVAAIPTNPILDTEDGSSFTSLPDATLADGSHGGSSATLELKSIAVSNGDAGGIAVDIEGTGTGNSHALRLDSTNGKAMAIGAGGDAVTIDAVAGAGLTVIGATGDIVADITGNLSGSVGSVTGAVGSVTGNVGGDVQGNVDGTVAGVTPAAAGDEMDLVDAPNATAVTAIQNGLSTHTAGDVWDESLADGEVYANQTAGDRLRKIKWAVANKMEITEADGTVVLYKDDGTTAADVGTPAIDSAAGTTTRDALYGTT